MSAGAAEAQLRSAPYLAGLSLPVAIAQDPTDSGVQLVVEQAGRLSLTVRNAGPLPAGPFRVRFFMAPASNPPPAAGAGVDVGFKGIASLGANAGLATTAVVTVPADLATGSYLLSAVADADGAIPEAAGHDDAADNGRVAVRPINVVRPPGTLARVP